MLSVTHGDDSFPLSTIKSSPASGDANHHTLYFLCVLLLNLKYTVTRLLSADAFPLLGLGQATGRT